ncbi:class I SAM-dependent methyltransferase [Subtercola frigoramans]|uniref:SAM-dependent methyltransferase n=1 Tax=Subtercola frigoramans TaxID=120298 RepID=A0ABS2L032_9MICO|nr:class I SAM-dependent methyltransferase [Subtercola frigoramans]MBM7470437.1 SAM-dependent methyltransferase [Subtercola frigoramans]
MTRRDPTHALSFGRAVGDYDRGRPRYPDAAVDWVLAQTLGRLGPAHAAAGPLDALDVGAGTGKFTASLLERGLNVTAVEPDPVMRTRLTDTFGSSYGTALSAVDGTAEALPVAAACADLVTFAQSWHWVDVTRASAEASRVLRPGGTLALVWNIRDDSAEWVAELGAIMGTSSAERFDSISPPVGAPLHTYAHADFYWDNTITRESLLAMVTSRSYVIALQPDARGEMLRMIELLLDEHPHLAGRTSYLLPYVTRVTLVAS